MDAVSVEAVRIAPPEESAGREEEAEVVQYVVKQMMGSEVFVELMGFVGVC